MHVYRYRAASTVRALVLAPLLLALSGAGGWLAGSQVPSPRPLRLSPQEAAAPVLSGEVVDASSSAPIPGALVLLRDPLQSTVTDREGRFTLRPGDSPLVRLRVEAAGYLPLEREAPSVEGSGGGGTSLRLVLHPDPLRLQGVTVTASPLRGTAVYQPATAFDRQALQRRMGVSLAETLDGSPGVTLRSMGPAPARPVIRGLDGDRVLVLQNGERPGDLGETAPDHAVTLDPLAAERVEIVRGPASLLYGSSALGGVVNVLGRDIPRDWSPGVGGGVSAHLASVNRMAATTLDVVAGGDRWAGAVRGSVREAGDLRTPEGRLDGTFSRNRSAGMGVGYRSDSSSGGLALSAMSHRYGLPEGPQADVGIDLERSSLQGRWTVRREGWVQDAEVRLHLGRYAHEEIERLPGGTPGNERVGLSFRQRNLSATATLRHAAWGVVGQGALALSLLHRALAVGGEEALTPDAARTALGIAAFQEVPLGHRVRVHLGLRGEREDGRARPNGRFRGEAPEERWAPGIPRTRWMLSGALGLAFRPSDVWEAGLQGARAHRAPTPEELWSDAPHPGAGAYEVGDPSLGHEVGHGVDLFVRRTGRVLQGELALFANRIDGFIVQEPRSRTDPGSGLPVLAYAAADALLVGGEAWLEVAPGGGWSLRGAVDHVSGRRRGVSRDPLPFMPPTRLQLALGREIGIGWVRGSLRSLARQRRTAPGEASTEGATLVGAELGMRNGGHTLVLRVDNLLDRAWHDHLSRIENRGHPMPGRNVVLVYRAEF